MVAKKREQRWADLMTQVSEEERFYETQKEQSSGSDSEELEGLHLCPQPWGLWSGENKKPVSKRSLQIKPGECQRAQKCPRQGEGGE